jgi:hypothetical protein
LHAHGTPGNSGYSFASGDSGMNEWGALFLLASIIAIFSIPFVLFALVMGMVGRIAKRTLVVILAADSIVWGMSIFYWWALA